MGTLFKIKRRAYLLLKPIVNAVPPLKALNKWRRKRNNKKKLQTMRELGPSLAKRVVDVLEAGGYEPILVFGTLLGAVREGRFLRHDYDLDFGVELDTNEDWAGLKACMEAAGFTLARQFSLRGAITEQAYEADGFLFDIFGLMPVEGSDERRAFYYCLLDEGVYESDDDRSVKYIDLPAIDQRIYVDVDGVKLPIPANAEDCLTRAYTEHWRVPDPTWVSGTKGGWVLMEGVTERRTVFSR